MTFSSLIFLYAFLPLNLIALFFARSVKAKNVVLLVFSLIFYAWGEPKYVFLLLAMSLVDWFCALRIGRSKVWLGLGVGFNLLILGIFKYLGFFGSGVAHLLHVELPVLPLPLGISFYTFQLITYMVDVYRGEVEPRRDWFTVLLYCSLYHQCVAGPIVRYSDMEAQLLDRKITPKCFTEGGGRFARGLCKKVLLANPCGNLADNLIGASTAAPNMTRLAAIIGVLAYTLQIYLDFSAYSDMAIGLGKMCGITYPENFDHPYMSKTVTEFWRRWHMTLGRFFRDYVYIPLGGNRKGKLRGFLNLFIVWAITGLWHGASWNFVLWGLWSFLFIMLERLFLKDVLEKSRVLSHIYLLAIVYFGWALFRYSNMADVAAVIGAMFKGPFTSFETNALVKSNAFLLLASCVCCTPVFKFIREAVRNRAEGFYRFAASWLPPVMVIIASMALVGDSYNPFIYSNF